MESSAEKDSDDELTDDINLRVAKVLAPVMKKMKRHSKRIEALEEMLVKQTRMLDQRLPKIEKDIAALERASNASIDQLRKEVGERVLHVDHAPP